MNTTQDAAEHNAAAHNQADSAPGETVSAPLVGFLNRAATASDLMISVVTPMYNEEGAAGDLIAEIDAALRDAFAYEIIAVDDASQDATAAALARAAADAKGAVRVLRHQRNAGQSRAIRTGVLAAHGDVIVTLDGDGQNNPADIPRILSHLMAADAPAGLMMVAGERRKRQDSAAKRFASRVANKVRSSLLKDQADDTGCGLKAFYREAYMRLPYFDHSHRYLPALMRREGFEIAFQPVSHRARMHGRSKYTNLGRLAVAFRDLLGVLWLIDRARSPISVAEVRLEADCDKDQRVDAERSLGRGAARTPGA